MALRRSLVRAICTLFTCLLVSASAAPSLSARANAAEIVAPYSAHEADARETEADRAEALTTRAPATLARSSFAPSPARPHPKHEQRALLSRVYLQHCALLL